MFLPSRVKARVPYTGDRFSVSLLERRRVLLFHWTARGSGSIGETLFVLKCRLDGAHSPPGERGPWLTTTSPPPAPVLAAPRSQRVLQLPHPTLLWGTWEWQSIRWQPGRGGHEACSGHGRTVPSENSRSFPAPHTVPAPAGGGELEGSVSALSPPPEASGPRPGMHREIGLGSERPGHGGRAGHRGRPATPREGGFGAPAGTSEFKGWTPRPQNGALFGNRVTAGVISSDEVILGGGNPMIVFLYGGDIWVQMHGGLPSRHGRASSLSGAAIQSFPGTAGPHPSVVLTTAVPDVTCCPCGKRARGAPLLWARLHQGLSLMSCLFQLKRTYSFF